MIYNNEVDKHLLWEINLEFNKHIATTGVTLSHWLLQKEHRSGYYQLHKQTALWVYFVKDRMECVVYSPTDADGNPVIFVDVGDGEMVATDSHMASLSLELADPNLFKAAAQFFREQLSE